MIMGGERMSTMTQIGVSVTAKDLETLDKLAEIFGLSRSAMAAVAIRQFTTTGNATAFPAPTEGNAP
jgi:metal-responsive CopG/Arc/MetJ family transcriptional regulator